MRAVVTAFALQILAKTDMTLLHMCFITAVHTLLSTC